MNLNFLFTAVSSSLSPERDATQRSIKLNPVTPKQSAGTDAGLNRVHFLDSRLTVMIY